MARGLSKDLCRASPDIHNANLHEMVASDLLTFITKPTGRFPTRSDADPPLRGELNASMELQFVRP